MHRGQVKWFNASKGYGFAIDPDGREVFVHYSQIQMDGYKTLERNQLVAFDLIETDKGIQAHNIRVLEPSA